MDKLANLSEKSQLNMEFEMANLNRWNDWVDLTVCLYCLLVILALPTLDSHTVKALLSHGGLFNFCSPRGGLLERGLIREGAY